MGSTARGQIARGIVTYLWFHIQICFYAVSVNNNRRVTPHAGGGVDETVKTRCIARLSCDSTAFLCQKLTDVTVKLYHAK